MLDDPLFMVAMCISLSRLVSVFRKTRPKRAIVPRRSFIVACLGSSVAFFGPAEISVQTIREEVADLLDGYLRPRILLHVRRIKRVVPLPGKDRRQSVAPGCLHGR